MNETCLSSIPKVSPGLGAVSRSGSGDDQPYLRNPAHRICTRPLNHSCTLCTHAAMAARRCAVELPAGQTQACRPTKRDRIYGYRQGTVARAGNGNGGHRSHPLTSRQRYCTSWAVPFAFNSAWKIWQVINMMMSQPDAILISCCALP